MDKNSASAFRLRERLSRRDEKFSISLSPEALSGNCIKKRLQNSPPLIFCRVFFVYRRSPAYMEIPSGFSLGHIFALQNLETYHKFYFSPHFKGCIFEEGEKYEPRSSTVPFPCVHGKVCLAVFYSHLCLFILFSLTSSLVASSQKSDLQCPG